MARMSPEDRAAKWVSRMQSSTQDYVKGIQRVTVAPGAAAAANSQGYINGVQANQQKWAKRVAAVPLSDWQDAAANKGAQRLASGAAAALQKVTEAHRRTDPMLDAAANKIRSMPRSTPAERIARATAHMQAMYDAGQAANRNR